MNTRAAITSITSVDLPEYPIRKSDRLEGHFYVEWHFNRWLSSSFRLLSDLDVRAIGIDLFFVSQNEAPVGTLPQDERLLARLVGVDVETWRRLDQREISPLNGWRLCLCEGEVRWFHPVVQEMAEKALQSRAAKFAQNEQRRTAKRLADLKSRVEAMGASHCLKQANFLDRLDGWLNDNHTGNRTEVAIRTAMDEVSK